MLLGQFWDFIEENHLGSAGMLIYLYLLKEGFNRNNVRFSISDVQISKDLNLTKKTVKVNKDILLKNGLINFKTKIGVPCRYQIITQYPIQADKPVKQKEKKISRNLVEKKQEDIGKQLRKIEQNSQSYTKESIDFSSKKGIQNFISTDNPTFQEFLLFVQTLNSYEDSLDKSLKLKYQEWSEKGWKNNLDRPITDWKSAIKNAIPYLKNKSNSTIKSIQSIPKIRRLDIEKF